MPAKQQKNGKWKIVKKDGSLGKRGFSSKKNALAAQRGAPKGGKKPAKKGGGGGKKAVANPGNNNKAPGTGKAYQGIRLTGLALAVPTEAGILVAQGRRSLTDGIQRMRVRAVRQPHIKHQVVNVADLTIDRNKRVQQAASLTRMSVTAWLPEVLVAARTAEDWFEKGIDDPWQLHRNYVMRVTGYDPGADDYKFSRAREYRIAKHLGQVVRIAARKMPIAKRVGNILKEEILNPLGMTL